MKMIFALQGISNSGKTRTLRVFAEMLLDKNFKPLSGENFPEKKLGRTGKPKDFWQIFEADGVKIGVASSGDIYQIVRDQLDNLIRFNCEICICACRSFGGTVTAVAETEGYDKKYHPKTSNNEALTQQITNNQDALDLLNLLEEHLKNGS